MAYNLPPPWDPGFALPQNVRDEGLQRRAFVTKWMPRGTYDDPSVGDGGYTVPQYVLAEGYGQGTHTTKWSPSGTVQLAVPHFLNRRPRSAIGPKRGGARQVAFAPPALSGTDPGSGAVDTAFPEPYDSYGKAAASHIMAKISGLTSSQKKVALKKILDTVDPTLWSRTAQITRRHVAMGMAPAPALQTALARSMSAGMIAEIMRTGKSGKYPEAKGQLGLGCYGCVAVPSPLGVTPVIPGGTTLIQQTVAGGAGAQNAGVATGSTDGVCTSDGKLMMVSGKWRVRAPDEPCTSNIASEDFNYVLSSKQPIYVGPVQFDPTAGPQVYTISRPDQVPVKWPPWIQQVVTASTKACVAAGRCSQCSMAHIDPTLTGPCNQCMDQSKCLGYSGFQNLCPPQSDAKCTTVQSGAQKGQPITYEMNRGYQIPDPTAALIGGSSLSTGKDAQGNTSHFVQYPNDPNTYGFFTASDWATSLGIPLWCITQQPNQLVSGLGIGIGDLGSILSAVVSDPLVAAEHAPLAFFQHPITGERWGVWLSLGGGGPGTIGYPSSVGKWDVKSDAPFSYQLQVGFAPYNTDPPWWQEMLQVIFWIPALLFDVIDTVVTTVVSGLGAIACATLGSPGAVGGAVQAGKSVGGAAGGAVAGAGATLAGAICGGGQVVVAPPPTNWTNYLLIGGGALALVLLATRKKKKPATTPSGGASP